MNLKLMNEWIAQHNLTLGSDPPIYSFSKQ